MVRTDTTQKSSLLEIVIEKYYPAYAKRGKAVPVTGRGGP
jgi:hypothetical protein